MTEPTVRRFRRRPIEVQAVQVQGDDTGDLARAIAAWCRGSLSGTYRQPKVLLDEGAAHVGDWIVREPAAWGHTHRIVREPDMREQHEEIDPT
ncbi:hypothetical protein [Embleya sp. NPDC020630]|uniref:hypothetical protein n=1 Tax=Embleya sp. NPDC020630 TaxID=3363979 RepID=UPI0037BC2B4E